MLGNLARRRVLVRRMDLLIDYVAVHIPRLLTTRGHDLPSAARDRFHGAAAALRRCQAQLVISDPDTVPQTRQRLAELAAALITGHYAWLPAGEDGAEAWMASAPRRPARIAGAIVIAVVPVGVVAGSPLVGIVVPDYLRQWLAGFAVVWFIAKVLQALDPTYGNTWDRVQTAVSSLRPPSDGH